MVNTSLRSQNCLALAKNIPGEPKSWLKVNRPRYSIALWSIRVCPNSQSVIRVPSVGNDCAHQASVRAGQDKQLAGDRIFGAAARSRAGGRRSKWDGTSIFVECYGLGRIKQPWIKV